MQTPPQLFAVATRVNAKDDPAYSSLCAESLRNLDRHSCFVRIEFFATREDALRKYAPSVPPISEITATDMLYVRVDK
jgi:hypothetical protein